jgi:hypothetical protein
MFRRQFARRVSLAAAVLVLLGVAAVLVASPVFNLTGSITLP